jgi:hypothetical protein
MRFSADNTAKSGRQNDDGLDSSVTSNITPHLEPKHHLLLAFPGEKPEFTVLPPNLKQPELFQKHSAYPQVILPYALF